MKILIAAITIFLTVSVGFLQQTTEQSQVDPGPEANGDLLYRLGTTRASIEYLLTAYGDRYSSGRCYLEKLGRLEGRYRSIQIGNSAALEQIEHEITRLQREALLRSPVID